jgi:hypothetical protein
MMSCGAWTWAVASPIGTDQSVPIAFQYSSSWSANAFSAPFTVYSMVYTWRPVMSRSGSPIRMCVSPSLFDTSTSAGVPAGVAVTVTSLIGMIRSNRSS